jgi:hypothetical protein
MRESIALVLFLAVGCGSTRAPVNRESRAEIAAGQFVTLPRLASSLDLLYQGEGSGFIKLSAPPDQVLLVKDSTRAWVNDRTVSMEYPCMRRGEDYVIYHSDAAKVTQTLAVLRSARREYEAPIVKRTPTHRAPVSDFPAEWRPGRGVQVRPWRWIVVHHMASEKGSAAAIHRLHLARGFDGLGYHFVIGNGTLSADGQIEVGYRWTRQIQGAHARAHAGDDNKWNERGIGICLVGNFQGGPPSARQMESLLRLVRALQREYGIRDENVLPHRYVKPTLCPGQQFPWQEFKRALAAD